AQRDYIVKYFLLELLQQVQDGIIDLSEYGEAAKFINDHLYQNFYHSLKNIETDAIKIVNKYPVLKKVLEQRIRELKMITHADATG
ncbi:MAG TPA: hypothetical protein PLM16_02310, partial [Candidatus Woesebacteria bacterium]|nr:hypothetical protein [Candidatus Woesebacteria bacterium]